jgi:hypothetical protein
LASQDFDKPTIALTTGAHHEQSSRQQKEYEEGTDKDPEGKAGRKEGKEGSEPAQTGIVVPGASQTPG